MSTTRTTVVIGALCAMPMLTSACSNDSSSGHAVTTIEQSAQPHPSNTAKPNDAHSLEATFADGHPDASRLASGLTLQGALALAPPAENQAASISAAEALKSAEAADPSIAKDPGQASRFGLWSQVPPGRATIPGQVATQRPCWLILSPSLPISRHGGVPAPGHTAQPETPSYADYLSVVDAKTGQSLGTYTFQR